MNIEKIHKAAMAEIIRIRASSLAELFDCPARWKARHIDHLPEGKRSVFSHIGTATHAATAAFDRLRLQGAAIKADDAAGIAVDRMKAFNHPEYEVLWEVTPKQAEKIAVTATSRYCLDIAPQYQFTAVELECEEVHLDMGDNLTFKLTGTLDRIYTQQGKFGISDFKTGKRAINHGIVELAKHGAQLAEYELLQILGSRSLNTEFLLPARIMAINTMTGEAGVGELKAPHKVLLGDEENPGMLEMAARILKNELWVGNPRSMLCSEKYCPAFHTCRWRFT